MLNSQTLMSNKEVSFAAGISIRIVHELVRRNESLFPQRKVPVYEAGLEKDNLP